MGAINSAENQKNFYQILQFVKFLDVSKSLMKDPKSGEQFVLVEHTFPSEQQMEKFSRQLNKRKEMSHQYYMGPIKQLIISTNNLCSKQHKAIQIFKWEEYTLNDEIQSRREEKRAFTDKEIWSILCSCVLAMSHFTKNQIIHTTLHSKDIILTSEGQVKILSSELSDYQFDYNYKHGFYYAPETLKAINTRSLYSISNKAAVFTLAITILSVINCQSLIYLYKDNLTIDFTQLNALIQKIANKDLKIVLFKMLKQAAYERISFPELQDMLYSILENDEMNTESNSPQLQKLEQSICRLKTQQGCQQSNLKAFTLAGDQQDLPNILDCYTFSDKEVLDEAQNVSKERQAFDNKTQLFSYKMSQTNFRQPLAQKSNSIQISQSLKIVDADDKKGLDYISSLSKTSRVTGPYYVTEQYTRGRYEGYKENGMRQGFGTFFYSEGGKYCGEWSKNKMQGRGALYYVNGQLAYEGEWSEDQLHGYGVLYNQSPNYTTTNLDWRQLDDIGPCWIKYQGHFFKDMKNGEGTLFLSNGQYYRGEFKNDLPYGKGIFRILNGQLLKGVWRSGIFQSFQE